MSALSVRLPHSLHERARELAEREGISINQLVATALAEKMAAIMTAEHLDARAGRGSRSRFLAALAQVPAAEPLEGDALPPARPKGRSRKRGVPARPHRTASRRRR